MILYITDRNIRVYDADNQISYNSDYIAKFVFDDEWNGKIKTARFIQDNEHFDVILVNDKCKIPPLKNGHIKIGVFTDSMTSTYADVYFKTSIKDGAGNPTEPPEDVYAQLTSLIESGILKGDDGLTPYVGSNNNWWIGDIDTGVLARGTDGEDGYTPVKGVDYFIEEEIQQIQNEVSGGAIGDFKAVVDEETATFNTNAENTLTGYNANAQEKFDTYNANADSKFETYNTNAETKFSGYNTNAEAKLSEYNKNDLDKTTLYNTNADSKFTKYNTNAEAKFSEYTNNADTKLAEYNQNDSDKTDLYNTNAESKLGAYDSNAQAKLDLYNQNDSEKTETYNSNAQTKLDAYNENADNRLSEYNENADNRDAEFNAQTEQIQTDISGLKSDLTGLQTVVDSKADKTDLDKTNLSLDALWKMNRGQTYDVLEQESEAYSVDVPSGAKYVSVDKVGGKSLVWNQLVDGSNLPSTKTINGIRFTNNGDGSITVDGTATENANLNLQRMDKKTILGHKYLMLGGAAGGSISTYFYRYDSNGGTQAFDYGNGAIFIKTAEGSTYITIRVVSGVTVSGLTFKPQLVDLTLMFGAGNEPTAEQFTAMFPADSYSYNPGEIISSRTATITAGAETITTGFPELKSAGTAHDEIDMDGGQVTRNVYTVELETLVWRRSDGKFKAVLPAKAKANGYYNTTNNELCNKYEPIPMNDIFAGEKGIATHATNGETVWIFDSAYETPEQLGASLSGAVLQYKLETPTTEPVAIPEALQEWLPVEPGGTVAFRNADESKQLAVPNAVSWVRKLDEVN